MSAALKSQRFREEREADWKRLEGLMDRAEKRSVSSLSDEEILAIPVLYRSTLSALSVARETSLDRGLIDYLEVLSARAYFFVYGSRSTLPERLGGFFRKDWPAAVRSVWRETVVAALLTVLGAVAAALLIAHDAQWYHVFVPQALAGGRDPAAATEVLREMLYDGGGSGDGLSVFATFLFTHNAQVALLAFALGFAFCIPSLMLLIYNGATLGAFLSLYFSRGLGFELGGWLLIHGVTELFAVMLAGAAGIRVGWSLAFPGALSRLDSLAAAGRTAGAVMGGVVVMLFFAGLLEGFGRQLITHDLIRYGVAAATAVLWGAYFYGPRREVAR
ncbi:stage II sporulation protein M [Phenylobacterium sp. NIBR 498073]|uniref:stage II sporulation protein M n=1 Tax=Phenylobacterium sp. NIBR 498073 TaxID=3015177 RepID=UPI0022B4C02E|nr:stage II sporulation protein M [Phenylobacterium sp. NIBR 498073]WGU38296.1 stage II sporulation protein M [Phenylobacterium sp. NIBR 498073]